jgi:hypothetical protein
MNYWLSTISLLQVTQPLPQAASQAHPPGILIAPVRRGSIGLNEVATERDVKPVALLTFHKNLLSLSNLQGARRGHAS